MSPTLELSLIEMAYGYNPDLHRVALRYAQGNQSLADDFVQSTYVRVLEREHLYQEKGNLLGWLMTVMIQSVIFDYYGKKSNQEKVGAERDPSGLVFTHYVGSTEEDLIAALDAERALDLVGNPDFAAVLEQRLCGGEYTDIAEMLGIRMGTVMSRLNRARRELSCYRNDFF